MCDKGGAKYVYLFKIRDVSHIASRRRQLSAPSVVMMVGHCSGGRGVATSRVNSENNNDRHHQQRNWNLGLRLFGTSENDFRCSLCHWDSSRRRRCNSRRLQSPVSGHEEDDDGDEAGDCCLGACKLPGD